MLQQIPTASYCIVLDHKGEMFCGIGDMDCMDHVTPSLVMEHADTIRSSPLVVVEANMSVETIHSVCMLCNEVNVPGTYVCTHVHTVWICLIRTYYTMFTHNKTKVRPFTHVLMYCTASIVELRISGPHSYRHLNTESSPVATGT